MTRYTVTWWKAAADELAEIWLTGPDRTAIAQASHVIDQQLREHAGIWIERSAEEPYFINAAMLRAYFRVSEMDRLVEIFKVVRVNEMPE
jgi:hypothetical protein